VEEGTDNSSDQRDRIPGRQPLILTKTVGIVVPVKLLVVFW
jgi:hypothetical protein